LEGPTNVEDVKKCRHGAVRSEMSNAVAVGVDDSPSRRAFMQCVDASAEDMAAMRVDET
jgi:hypothetical protein